MKTPYYKTFFIDTDTYFCESCVELFYLLDFYDVLAATAPADIRLVEKEKNKIIGYYPYNSGVMLYKKNEKVLNFIKEWHKIFIKKYNIYYGDQPALMEALLYHDIKIYALSNIYNFRSPYYNGITGDKVKIIHGRSEDYELLEKELNRYTGNRIWDPINKKIIFPNQ
ncbi:MAG TPA: putative nucleotide-diphospho-sugar transferase [Prolixibacteraceae bacterium]|nr:putative nucleotide-diphospho-sugar transferase [Prolixibacteraceae bacterium]